MGVHKPKKFTQQNKKHKDVGKSMKNKKQEVVKVKGVKRDNKEMRKYKSKQKKQLNKQEMKNSIFTKKGTNDSAPILCGLIPLSESMVQHLSLITSMLKQSDTDGKIINIQEMDGFHKLNHENFIFKSKKFRKNLSFVSCKDFKNLFSILDLMKVIDWALFIIPDDFDELESDYTLELLKSIYSQGLPSSCFIDFHPRRNPSVTKKELAKYLRLNIEDNYFAEKDAPKLLRHLSESCKPSYVQSKNIVSDRNLKYKRGYFLSQFYSYDNCNSELTITGCMRGYGINCKMTKYIHITGIGDFPMKEIKWINATDANRLDEGRINPIIHDMIIDHTETDKFNQDIVNECSDEEMESEEEEEEVESIPEMDDDGETDSIPPLDEDKQEGDSDEDDSEEEYEERMSVATTALSGYSVAQIEKFKAAREECHCPDEVVLDRHEIAQEKFKKYRAINNFRKSEWPTNEDLPLNYDKIFDFANFFHDRNRLCKFIKKIKTNETDNFIHPGSRCAFVLKDFSKDNYTRLLKNSTNFIVCTGLLPKEEYFGIVHLNQRRLDNVDERNIEEIGNLAPSNDNNIAFGEEATTYMEQNCGEVKPVSEPIKSDEEMLFQIGFRRFLSCPIYSEHNSVCSNCVGSRGKTKYCQFMESGKNVIASMVAPIIYAPVNTLQFRIRQDEFQEEPPYVAELVATGSVIHFDSTKPIIERVQIAGDVYKMKGKSAIVRFMFHNSSDVQFFKQVPISTRTGILGRIKDSIGEKGYMKCMFKRQFQQNEVIVMSLYKRVFPTLGVVQNFYELHERENEVKKEQQMDTIDAVFK